MSHNSSADEYEISDEEQGSRDHSDQVVEARFERLPY